ncbi:Jid1p NDAI_0A05220 [Naumovozyma dairenensis CBS 421]|uniref:J domain-containing protein n=1 Tax=Naumovozyma dairenensis (strain ATCC 10597 / BCRC 20456 / CBS 421 / NBRC 0211 / NRRL Y-12639) TaxID=1071378 RepID=G0W4D9_NAUDC|nr:hypothetical protein NDAI_0A05220 [Naumovozyma dairenensis CBS 421]CCD22677.1 hypothetical protein NDAI_0A05220 [Naumovozyma dairenensis CBS 421]
MLFTLFKKQQQQIPFWRYNFPLKVHLLRSSQSSPLKQHYRSLASVVSDNSNNNNNNNDHHIPPHTYKHTITTFDKYWPENIINSNSKRIQPTPYEIFNISNSQQHINKKSLKKKYHYYVKLYHPDVSTKVNVLTKRKGKGNSTVIDMEEKLKRFKLISFAYSVLNDPNKKRQYDLKTMMNDKGSNMDSKGYNNDENYRYWNAGTWEDYNDIKMDDGNDMTGGKKLDPWVLFCWVSGLYISMEIYAALSRLQESYLNKDKPIILPHDELQTELFKSYNNFGLETDKWSRLRRFLWFRSWTMANEEQLDNEHVINEKLLQTLQDKKI